MKYEFNQNKYPQYDVEKWVEDPKEENGYKCVLVGTWNDDCEAIKAYNKTKITSKCLQVSLYRYDGETYEKIREKDPSGDYTGNDL